MDKSATKSNPSHIQIMQKVESLSLAKDAKGGLKAHPYFKSGDTIRISTRIKEGDKERLQVFEGYCFRRSGRGPQEVIVVRKESSGIGIERIFLLNSPNIAQIEKIRSGRVKKARLTYLRNSIGKKSKVREKQSRVEAKS